MRVLMTSYACHPDMGSEPGYGWNWPAHVAARGNEVHVVTPPMWREAIERELAARPRPGLFFVYERVPTWPLKLGRSIGSMLQYLLWQRAVARRASSMQGEQPFDVVHHVSYGSLLGGSRLWRVGPPLVFGPAGGGQIAPGAFSAYFGRYWRKESLRNSVVRGGWRLLPGARAFASHSALILAGNRETAVLARRLGARNVQMMLDVGVPADFLPKAMPSRPPHGANDPLELLWVGRVLPRKALDLALDVLEECVELPLRLTVVGDDYPDQPVVDHERLRRLGARAACTGTLPWEDVAEAYRRSDVFLFTSLRDSCGVQLLEAMAFGLPIVTLDHQGAALLVPDDAGIKVRVGSPDETVAGLAAAVRRLARDPGLAAAMGRAGYAAAHQHTWDQKAEAMLGYYAQLTGADTGSPSVPPEPDAS